MVLQVLENDESEYPEGATPLFMVRTDEGLVTAADLCRCSGTELPIMLSAPR